MGLTMSPADPDIVYAFIESKKTGLYKSTDGGMEWDLVSTKTSATARSTMRRFMPIRRTRTACSTSIAWSARAPMVAGRSR